MILWVVRGVLNCDVCASRFSVHPQTNTSMQKRTENEQLGKPIHPNIPPTRPTNHRTTGKRTQPTLRPRTTTTEQKRQYTSRHHTNKHGASTHIQVSHTSSCMIVNIPYYHVSKTIIWMLYIAENIPPHNWNTKKQEKLTSSNCTRHGN